MINTESATEAQAIGRMSAVVQGRYGGTEQLRVETIAQPTVGPKEVLIDVRAAGVDRGVWHLMTGTPYLIRLMGFGLTKPKNPVPGLDVSGVVVAVGNKTTRFAVGEEVFGIAKGSFAERAVADETKLSRKPARTSFVEAAAAAVSGITALQALTDVGRVTAGQRVLVVGASGGVGSYAVQLAKAVGAEVTGVASTAKLGFVNSLGADHVVDYTGEDVFDGQRLFDLIIDIGGRNSVRRLRRALAKDATLVIVGGEDGNRFTGGIGRQLWATILSPFVSHRLRMFVSTEHHSFIDRLAEFIEAGTVVPAVGEQFALDDAPEAIRRLEAGQTSGKSVVVVSTNQ